MGQEHWIAVDDYIAATFGLADAALVESLRSSEAAGLPAISVSPPLGQFLHLIARIRGARTILEIGTLGGYSTIWLARALPAGGRLVTLEIDPVHADVARGNLQRAGVDSLVELRLGPANESLAQLVNDGATFDLIFIDADKTGYPDYLAWSLKLSRPGTVIIADNIVRKGAVADPDSDDAAVRGVRRFNELVAAEPRLSATVIQTVGGKGYDGFMMAVVSS